MHIEMTASEFKELLERKADIPSVVEDVIGMSLIHKLGDARYSCDNEHMQELPDRLEPACWVCTLPRGHSGSHAAVPCKDLDGKAITWEDSR